ncbi:pLS20_p028 family conjugation system transmembrane protein (plasmid) [Enterococcus sp. 22-H-5-01]|uniref:pLS20_p028 family conjugation system transmembrane protein n=1 Tax=Enterococcus sp. 22-H-5-01 TaxID=3418555 RepID=UPI003D001277
MKLLDISEQVDTGGLFFDTSPLSEEGQTLLSKQLKKVDGKYTEAKLKSWWGLGDPAYYRYSWHPWLILFELLTKAVVYGFVIFKSAKMIMELGILNVITSGIALTDIKDGQRNKQLALKIRDTFVVLYLMMFLINFFDIWSAFVAGSNLGFFVKPIAVAAGAWLVIDGPNFIEQLFGIDAGLSSVGRTVIAAAQGGGAIKGMTSAAKNGAKAGVQKAGSIGKNAFRGVAYAGSAGKGALDGFKSKGGGTPPPTGKPTPNGGDTPLAGNDPNDSMATNPTENPINGNPNTTETPSANNGGLSGIGQPNGAANKPTTEAGKMPKELKNATPPVLPMSNNAMKQQQEKNKEALSNAGIDPKAKASDVSSASKARKALEGKPQIPMPPNVSSNQLPKNVQEAKAQLQKDMQPRPIDTETVGDKVVGTYANVANNIHKGPTMTRSRKVYDVSKATSKRMKDGFND